MKELTEFDVIHTIKHTDIKEIFEKIIRKEITFDEAADWSRDLYEKYFNDLLIFSPEYDVDKYWGALSYLTGVDLLTSPNEYLHDIDNIIDEYEVHWGDYKKP